MVFGIYFQRHFIVAIVIILMYFKMKNKPLNTLKWAYQTETAVADWTDVRKGRHDEASR